MPAKTAAAGAERILHCSPERTVVERTDADGRRLVWKLFLTGSPADAEHELGMARLAAGPGVAVAVAVATDPHTLRPSLAVEAIDGVDCRQLVAQRGALPAAEVCRLLQPVAATLARLHAMRRPEAPAGLCHGDVKPDNLVATATTTVLLDFEHASTIGSGPGGAVAAPTPFTPPEAAHGAAPSAAGDVYGLGATLAWLLAGGGPPLPQHPELSRLLQACLAPAPAARPPAAAVAQQLQALATQLARDPGEAALDDALTGSFALTGADLPADARATRWQRLARVRRRRWLAPHPALPADAGGLLAEWRRITRLLHLFPRHASTLERRRQLATVAGETIANAAALLQAAIKVEDFDGSATLLHELAALARSVSPGPTGLPVPARAGLAGVGPAQRDAAAFLDRLTTQLQHARSELDAELQQIRAAEQRFDLRAAEAAVEQLANSHGGASPTAARERDRLHRLTFYLERVARAEPNVERVAPLWDAAALQPLTTFVADAVQSQRQRPRDDGGAVGLRSLQLILANLAEEFPHLAAVPPALEALTQALAHVTNHAFQLVGEAQQKLGAVPVPVRPLQLTLARLDTCRVLEAFVDLPDRPRSRLLDDIESLRLGFEQARTTRDRLAENAEHALARGHWTTGLFDMERAVAGLAPGDDHEQAEATRLHARLEEARRSKQEVEQRVRRNVELAGRYADLQDDPASTFAARLAVLEERRDCLLFLVLRVPSERALLYRQDLYGVEIQLALERAGAAEHDLDGTVDSDARLALANRTVEQLSASMSAAEAEGELPGRLVRLLDHWRTLAVHCRREVEQRQAERSSLQRHRRRMLLVSMVAVLVTSTALALAFGPWLRGEPAMAAEKQPAEGR